MKKGRTKLDQERLWKKQQAEGKELLDEMTQPDEEKAAKIIIEKNKEAEKATAEDEAEKKAELEKSLRFAHKEYVFKLAQTLNDMCQYIDLPKGYYYRVNFNEEKVNLMVHHISGKSFGRGIKPCGNPQYDFHAIGVLVTQAENTIDMMEGRGAFRKDGLIIPKEKKINEF